MKHIVLHSGKHPHNYGTSQFLIDKLSVNGQFSIAMLNYWGETTWIIIGPATWVVDAIPIFHPEGDPEKVVSFFRCGGFPF